MEDDSLELVRQDLTELEYDTAAVCKRLMKDISTLYSFILTLAITNLVTIGLVLLIIITKI